MHVIIKDYQKNDIRKKYIIKLAIHKNNTKQEKIIL